jgi:hypothetical protein
MTIKKTFVLYMLFVSFATLNACKHESPVPEGPEISFQKHVQPIITGNCTAAGCHPATGGEFSLVSYNDVIKNGEIKEGNGKDSELIEVIKETDDNKRMPPPPSPSLTANQIQIIELWVAQGAKNN